MVNQLTNEHEASIDQQKEVIGKALDEGKDRSFIVQELVAQGWQENSAMEFVDSVEGEIREYRESPKGRRELADQYTRLMLSGFLWAAGGTFVTVIHIKQHRKEAHISLPGVLLFSGLSIFFEVSSGG